MNFRLPVLAALATAALVAACGGGDDDSTATPSAATVALSGTAATGAAIANATVSAIDATGATVTATTGTDGKFTINVAEAAAPYALRITDAAGKTWYSYAPAAGTANITPLTTLALAEAAANQPLADVLSAWATTRLDSAAVLEAAKKVNANLQSVMQAASVNYTSANIFADTFNADGTGLDAVLDAMRVSFTCSASACTQSITSPQGSVLVNWNGNIATTGITLSWSASTAGGGSTGGSVTVGLGSCKAPVKGTYSLVVKTDVAGVGVPIPEVCVDGLPDKPASQSDFCGAADVAQQLPPGVSIVSCSYSGNQGTIAARITSPLTIDYSVTYTYVLN